MATPVRSRLVDDLEARVLAALWAAEGPQSVADLHRGLSDVADHGAVAAALERLTHRELARRVEASGRVRFSPTDAHDAARSQLAVKLLDALTATGHRPGRAPVPPA